MNNNTISYPNRDYVLEQSASAVNQMKNMNLAFGYSLYDVSRLQLEELHRIANAMESILAIIQKREQ